MSSLQSCGLFASISIWWLFRLLGLKYQKWFVSSPRQLSLDTFTLRSGIQIARPSSSHSFIACYRGSRSNALTDRSVSGPVPGNSIRTKSRYTDS